ncbi:SNF2-related protein [Robinsoniella peoriensis]|uniref:SNF2-related protein n=1 Tax=Robinsoniella peoriensis TaxID=180332 RepID=UPI003751E182
MKYNPHDYQSYAAEFIIGHPVSALLLDMGLGKTVITLTAIWELLLDYFEVRRVLVIAPLRVARDIWTGEYEKWDHLEGIVVSRVLGSVKERRDALSQNANVYVINRENLEWLIGHCSWDFDMVVIDELSSFKSHKAKRFKALKKVMPMVNRIVGLTGTPAPNGLIDLWAEIGILDMGQRLGRFIGAYREQFFLPDKRSRDMVYSYKPKEGAEEKIYELISDIAISMKATDYLDMPECIYNRVEVRLNKKEMRLYRQLEKDMLLPFEGGDVDAGNAAGLSNKLMQMANGAVYDENQEVKYIHERKIEALEDLVEAANGKPVLVAYWYKHDKHRLLEKFPAAKLESSEDLKRWNTGEIPLAIIHPASAGHGLNLQAGGSTLVWFGLTWSLELYQQMNARLWRQGQNETVVIHHLIAKGTLDEQAMASLEKKDVGQSALIDAVRARIGGIRDGCKECISRI